MVWRHHQPFFICWIGEDANQLPNHYKFDDICWIDEDFNQLPKLYWIDADVN